MASFGWRRGEASTWPARAATWLSDGEISFVRGADRWTVSEVGNQSTGCCPDVTSWTEVSRALDAAELRRPSGFTHEVVFRLCPNCQEHNIVREDDFVCVLCGSDLPTAWNADSRHDGQGDTADE